MFQIKNKQRTARASALLLVIILSTGLIGCSEGDDDNAAPANPAGTNAGGNQALQRIQGDTSFSIDTVNNKSLPKGTIIPVDAANTPNIIVAGWAVDGPAQTPAGGVIINIDGKTELPATYGAERADVATVLKNPNYKLSGFAVAIPTAAVGKGRHTLTLKILTADKKGYYEPEQKVDINVQ